MRKALMATISVIFSFHIVAIPVFAKNPGGKLSGELAVEGTGDSRRLLRAIAQRFEELHPETHIEVPRSIGSSGGIRLAGRGETELARTARPLEKKELDYGLTSSVFAISPLVFAVNPSVKGINDLTDEQIIGIYKQKITDWSHISKSSGKIYFVNREAGDSSRRIMEALVPGFAEIDPPTRGIFFTTQETVDAIEGHKNTIGYGPVAMMVNTNLKILKLNGVYPSAENVKNGSYKLAIPLAVVYKKESLSPLAEAFVDFLYSTESNEIIRRYGCLPVDRN